MIINTDYSKKNGILNQTLMNLPPQQQFFETARIKAKSIFKTNHISLEFEPNHRELLQKQSIVNAALVQSYINKAYAGLPKTASSRSNNISQMSADSKLEEDFASENSLDLDSKEDVKDELANILRSIAPYSQFDSDKQMKNKTLEHLSIIREFKRKNKESVQSHLSIES